MEKIDNIAGFLYSEDPLSEDATDYVINYNEEDNLIDFKLTLDLKSEKEWLEITKDISAFANTTGGYVVFGIKSGTWKTFGLDEECTRILSDANNIRQKINRFLDPDIENIRSKNINMNDKSVVIMYIPQTIGLTHMISKDGQFVHHSGKPKVLLKQGTFYVRRSAGNHLGDSRDLDQIIERRIDQFKEKIMGRISRVVKAPTESEVVVLTKYDKKYIIQDAPDSIPIKGMSFSIVPEETEEKIAAWTVISPGNPHITPPPELLWSWYENRYNLQITDKQRLTLAQFGMWTDVPVFFWLRGLRAQDIQQTLIHSIKNRPDGCMLKPMFVVASFLGKSFYKKALSALRGEVNRLSPAMRKYPSNGPKPTFCRPKSKENQSPDEFREELEKELSDIVGLVDGIKVCQPAVIKRYNAHELDCSLYAQDDKYS